MREKIKSMVKQQEIIINDKYIMLYKYLYANIVITITYLMELKFYE